MLLRVPRPDGLDVLIETRNIMLIEPWILSGKAPDFVNVHGSKAVMASGPPFFSTWTLEGWLTAAAGLGKSIQDRRLRGDHLARREGGPRA